MDLIELASGLITLVVFAALFFALIRPGYDDQRPVLLERMLRRQGDAVAHGALASGSHEFAAAMRKCVDCTEAAQCRAWLASGARNGYESFCPNAGYVERMQRLAR